MARIVIPYKPRDIQREMHSGMEAKRWSVIVAHRRCGKTVAVINHLIKQAIKNTKEDPRYAYIAPYYNQAKAIAWLYLTRFTAVIPGIKTNETESWIELPNKARIRIFGADKPDALRGLYFDGVALDEVAQMRPNVWGEIIRPALIDREGWAVFIGTPKGTNLFSDLYYSSLSDDAWYSGFFPASKTDLIPLEELEAARTTMGDAQYRQEMECDFTASSDDTLITLDLVLTSIKRAYHPTTYQTLPKVMGVDVARFGQDRSVIVVRHGTVARIVRIFRDTDTMNLAGHVSRAIDEHRPDGVFIDVVGLGAGVYDRLRQLGYDVLPVNAGESATRDDMYFNKRAEMWCLMREWIKDVGSIPDDHQLKSELTAPTYSYDNKNRYKLEKKEDMKERGLPSPDIADALAMTFYLPVQPASFVDEDELRRIVRGDSGRSSVGGY